MCRLVALSSDEEQTKTHEYIFNVMMMLSSRMNNAHGTGLVTQKEERLFYVRSGAGAEDFVLTEQWNDCMQQHEHTGLFGHTRLASSTWRNGFYAAHPVEHAHPHKVTATTLLMHNGLFKDHDKIAELLEIEPSKEVTDTMLFAKLLGGEMGTARSPTFTHLVEALRKAGACTYGLMILSTGQAGGIIVRGGKDIYIAQSNYGLLMNTSRLNIVDTVKETTVALASMGQPVLVLEASPTLLEEWMIYSLNGASLERLDSIPEEVREINRPPATVQTITRQIPFSGSGLGPSVLTTGGHDVHGVSRGLHFDWDRVFGRAKTLVELDSILSPVTTREELVSMLNEAHGTREHYWWRFSPKQLEELFDLLLWAFEEVPECAPSATKDRLWLEFVVENCGDSFEGSDAESLYQMATLIVPGFDEPYFLNTEEELEELVRGGSHVELEV